MEFYEEILLGILKNEVADVTFPNLKISAKELAEMKSTRALEKIISIIRNDSFDDRDCMIRIEQVVELFEDMNIDCGSRHK